MSVIISDLDGLKKYSNSLSNKRDEFETIKENMKRIIKELRDEYHWVGSDSTSFRVTAITYLNGLKEIENCLENQSSEINRQKNLYQARITNALSKLG